MRNKVPFVLVGLFALLLGTSSRADGQPTFFGPTPYLSAADTPFTGSFEYSYLENFEDGLLNTPGVTASGTWKAFSPSGFTDSVDGDDGVIDGSGTKGRSFFSQFAHTTLTITFNAAALGGRLPTHAGIVWTDVNASVNSRQVVFSARDSAGNLLGSIGPVLLGDNVISGQTAEDRFFGVFNASGISSITITMPNSNNWEVDHLQYGFQESGIPSCSYTVSPTSATSSALGGSASVIVTAPAGCSWIAVSNAAWITVASGASGTGGGTVGYTVGPNPTATARTGTLTIAGQTFTVTQEAATFEYPLAEGATGPFFDLEILLANPNLVSAPVTVTFLTPASGGLGVVVRNYTLAPQSRLTIRVDDIPGLENTAVSTVVKSTNFVPIMAERTMFWDQEYYGGHTEVTPGRTATKWYFAEGSQGFFDTYVLLGNGTSSPASATVTFLLESGTPVVRTYTVPANSRVNVFAGSIPELVGTSFSIVVDSNVAIIAERAMYFGTTRFWDGGHESAGVTSLATSWFHAEGATGAFFDTYILVGNPNAGPAIVTFTWLRDDGTVVTKTKTIAANARLTVNVETEDPQLANAAVSTTVTSDVPVISERAMYWPGGFNEWGEAHNSFGVTSLGTKWGLAEGRVGGARAFETYILLSNANPTGASVTLTFLRKSGAPVVKTFTVPPTSRFNVHVNSMVPELSNEEFGAVVDVTNGQPIAVERALYWSALGIVWAGGTNAAAVRLP
jgi:hypothetical protein